MLIGVIFVGMAFGLTTYNFWESAKAGKLSTKIENKLEQKIPVEPVSTDPTGGSKDDVPDYVLNPDMEMPVTYVDGNAYIGTLEIPALDLKLPVMSEWSYPNLQIAPCRYSGSAYKSNMVIAAHNYQTHFGRLRELKVGDAVTFTDADGNEFEYEVGDLEILQPTDVEEMQDSGWDLSLFTCTLDGRTRVTVRCKLASNQKSL
jgi:sortase A